MAKTLNEMKRPLIFAFKIGLEKYHVFQIVAWKVRTESMAQMKDGTLVCDCQLHRFESKCTHSTGVAAETDSWVYGVDDARTSEKPIRWQDGKEKQLVILINDEGKSFAVHPEVGNYDLFGLCWLLTEKTKTDDMLKVKGFLDPAKIYAQCKLSLDKGLSIISDEVKALGDTFTPLTSSGIEIDTDYDESLLEEEVPAVTNKSGKTEPPWKTAKRPDPKQFYVEEETWKEMLYTMWEGGNVLLTGPSGCGKSELVYIAAKALSLELAAFNMGAMSEPRTSLIGNTHFNKEEGTWFAESRFVRNVKHPRGCILLDEITRADQGAFNILLPLLDRQGYLALDEAEDAPIVKKGDHVTFVATANIGMEYTGTTAMDVALKNRFDAIVDVGFPPKEYEVKILLNRCPGLRAADATRLADIAIAQRKMCEDGEFVENVSTRVLIAAGKRVGNGMTFDHSIKFCLSNHFSAEGGDASERTKLLQIAQKGSPSVTGGKKSF